MSCAVLVIDDEKMLARNIESYLSRRGHEVQLAFNGDDGLAALETFSPDIVLVDFMMSRIDGLAVLRRIRETGSQFKVIIMTGHGDEKLAVRAMKEGAYDYLSKPVVLDKLKLLLDKAAGEDRIAGALAYYQESQAEKSGLAKLIGESAEARALKARIRRFLDAERRLLEGAPPAVLIHGETGTGKELIARAFHFDGPRRDKPFIELNCAAIPTHLLEAELFGYERGAFTDAKERKRGLAELADGGTLFLDEIAEMDLAIQAKLLRLLEDKRFRRLGGLRDETVDIRIIAATNQSIEKRIEANEFRADLFYRLCAIRIEAPPLRQRGGDVVFLARKFLRIHGGRYGRPDLRLAPAAEEALARYSWPGNVRELRNVIEHAVLLAPGETVAPEHLGLATTLSGPRGRGPISTSFALPEAGIVLDELESGLLTQALNQTGWNVTRAAKLLGLSRDTLRYRMEKYGIDAAQ
ncbi:MAG: sigma-54-dependent transcriptional regulator [Alphaproteobacteria bacterium]